MKKQLIIVGVALVLALLLFGAYIIYSNSTEYVAPTDPYTLTDAVKAEIEKVDKKIQIIISGASESSIITNTTNNHMFSLATAMTEANDKITISFDETGSFSGVIIKSDNEEKQIPYEDMFKKLEDGTKYAFDGERLYTNAILSLCGMNELSNIGLHALDGYDTDGDTVVASTGNPFMYPSFDKSNILSITVRNQYGNYKAYLASNGSFYFDGAEILSYDEELFASLVINARYVVTLGKVKNPLELSAYGLEDEETCTAVLTVVTLDKTTQKILIGDKTPSGDSYYAKSANKDFIYLLSASEIETAVLGPVEAYFTANLVNGISSQNDVYNVDDVTIDFLDEGFSLKADVYALMFTSNNISPYTDDDIVTIFTNKVKFNGTYSNWHEISTLGGFTSSDGKAVYLEAPIAKYGTNGKYTVSFGLLRDEDNSAYLPNGISASYSVDGKTFKDLDVSGVSFSQGNKELKNYSFDFQSDEHVLFVRVYFNTDNGKYIVLDELNVSVDGVDAQPYEGITGGWKLVSPTEYIPEGKNFIFPNTEFTSDFILNLSTLVGDRVVEIGLSTNPYDANTIKKEMLVEYGLDKPEKHASYVFNDIRTDVYFSHVNENGNYYCYSTLTSDDMYVCMDIIAEISIDTAPWLGWDILDFQEQQLFSMYINSIDTLTLTFDGKDYRFVLEKDDAGELTRVTIDGQEVDLQNFRYLYISILQVDLKDEYTADSNTGEEILKLKIESSSKSPEIIFYRVTTSKVYYTIDGSGQNYVLIDSLNTIKRNLKLLIAGEEVPHR